MEGPDGKHKATVIKRSLKVRPINPTPKEFFMLKVHTDDLGAVSDVEYVDPGVAFAKLTNVDSGVAEQ